MFKFSVNKQTDQSKTVCPKIFGKVMYVTAIFDNERYIKIIHLSNVSTIINKCIQERKVFNCNT